MRYFLAFFMLVAALSQAQTGMGYDDQLRLKYSEKWINHVKTTQPKLYNSYISELKSSFEFVDLKPDQKYQELIPFNFITQQQKAAPVFSEDTFSLYNYQFVRYKDQDVVYKIPNTNRGVLIYSKNKFESML
ncbi:MAG: hypothetical protein JXR60_10425 [Bacteroidales bacterium]|nr:hypothetical protein [Bacteroidales bacterium]